MDWSALLLRLLLLATGVTVVRGFSPDQGFGQNWKQFTAMKTRMLGSRLPGASPPPLGSIPHKFLNNNTAQFAVNGRAIPEVDFDVGESYAGLLPISQDPTEESNLFFWFFPTTNSTADKEIVIWLNGGPGCSSLGGLIQENGPFLWQPGTQRPVWNPWSWHTLSNIVYVDQPVGTGLSTGKVTANNTEDAAQQFLGWWKNFVDTFDLRDYKIYITGESYAGMFCPYIGSAMISSSDKSYFDLSGMLLYDPLIGSYELSTIPIIQFVQHWSSLFPLNDTFKFHLQLLDSKCGRSALLSKYLSYPPRAGPMPTWLYPVGSTEQSTCMYTYWDIYEAISVLNPCFDVYHITGTCPWPSDIFDPYNPTSHRGMVYFDRLDVKTALHIPNVTFTRFESCSERSVFASPDGSDSSWPSSLTSLPKVIDHTQNVIIGHGLLDMILLSNGTLLAMQNMTWGGKLGFQTKPTSNKFYVPDYSVDDEAKTGAGTGIMGTYGTERGLTYVEIELAGHMVPQFAPSAAYRMVEVLLGRGGGLGEN